MMMQPQLLLFELMRRSSVIRGRPSKFFIAFTIKYNSGAAPGRAC
jgi:hypothetical protein